MGEGGGNGRGQSAVMAAAGIDQRDLLAEQVMPEVRRLLAQAVRAAGGDEAEAAAFAAREGVLSVVGPDMDHVKVTNP